MVTLGSSAMLPLCTLIVTFAFLSYPVSCFPSSQYAFRADHTLSTPPDSRRILRRFSVRSAEELDDLLGRAQHHDWDVWQVTNTHVDVYFPDTINMPSEPSLQYKYHDTLINATSEISPDSKNDVNNAPGTPVDRWDLTSLENTTYHSTYHPLDDIYSFIHDLAATYPDLVSVVPLGHSGEGREMYALEISARPSCNKGSHEQKWRAPNSDEVEEPLGFVITGAQHAREWVATATTLYIAHALVVNKTEVFSLGNLLDRFSFYIVPVPNPDGYVYTWEHDRFWYKNRLALGPGATCTGVDMNRNWGYKWKPSASSKKFTKPESPGDTCSHWYPGHRPFQAPEVNNMAIYLERLPNLKAFVDLRNYGQMLSTPYSYSCKRTPKDAEDQLEAASGAINAVKKCHGTTFTTGQLCSTLYRAPGNVVDWMYARKGVEYSFAAHLRDTGTYGFSLPSRWIRPVGEETAQMIGYLAHFIATKERS